MNVRISQLENEEVDYLRFDRIKIQRKRMEHILEVIKDLTFKNKELSRQINELKQEIEQQHQLRSLYQDVNGQRQILIDKNMTLSKQLAKYRETALHQEMLINTLKQELDNQSHRNNLKTFYQTQPHFLVKGIPTRQPTVIHHLDESYASHQLQILKAQYKELQDEYSKLYKQQYKETVETPGHIYTQNKAHSSISYVNDIRRVWSSKGLEAEENNQTAKFIRLRQKYQRVKKGKKQLLKQIKEMQVELESSRMRQQSLLDLVELLKGKKTRICVCHVNKLERQLMSTLTEIN